MVNPQYSLVIPVYNEEESLRELLSETLEAMTGYTPYEIIFVDDCSSDQSPQIFKNFSQSFPQIVRVIRLNERSGQTFALRRGIEEAQGDIIITLDADLQNHPADIPRLLEKINEGYDCACGWRKARQDTLLKAGLSKFGNLLQRLLTGLKIHDVSCTLRAYRKESLRKINLTWEGQHRFIPLMLTLQGCRAGEIISNHRKRKYGVTKYSHRRIFRVVSDFSKIIKSRGQA